jgi:hypothetical protein
MAQIALFLMFLLIFFLIFRQIVKMAMAKAEKTKNIEKMMEELSQEKMMEKLSRESSSSYFVKDDPKEKADDTGAKKSEEPSVKYGRGMRVDVRGDESMQDGNACIQQVQKETEEFYSFSWKENDKVVCPDCGVENDRISVTCMLCGQHLK